uniref:Uncharacterized protein n=1 Tax=Rhizophora mucronata TaxID=61149 RepID=A0A2P2JFV6_RHIMU
MPPCLPIVPYQVIFFSQTAKTKRKNGMFSKFSRYMTIMENNATSFVPFCLLHQEMKYNSCQG